MASQNLKLNVGLRTKSVLIALALGMLFGLGLNLLSESMPLVVNKIVEAIDSFGQLFISLMKMLVIPVVFVSIVCGCSALVDKASLKQIGLKTLAFYVMTTVFALLLALSVASMMQFPAFDSSSVASSVQLSSLDDATLLAIVPDNFFAALVAGSTLQVIFVALLLGICLTLAGSGGRRIAHFFQDINQVITQMIMLVMLLTPYGVFCLIAKLFAQLGGTMITQLLSYFFLILLLLLMHAVLVYGSLLRLVAKVSPWDFVQKLYPAMVVAFSVASSNVALPVTLQMAKRRLGIRASLAEFVLPLGATINMDGTAIMQATATVMLAQWYHIDLSLWHYLTVILTALFASIGTAGVPGIGMITLAMVLNSVGIPLEGIGMIMGIDRLLDMARTVVNITGDCCIAMCLSGKPDKDVCMKG